MSDVIGFAKVSYQYLSDEKFDLYIFKNISKWQFTFSGWLNLAVYTFGYTIDGS